MKKDTDIEEKRLTKLFALPPQQWASGNYTVKVEHRLVPSVDFTAPYMEAYVSITKLKMEGAE